MPRFVWLLAALTLNGLEIPASTVDRVCNGLGQDQHEAAGTQTKSALKPLKFLSPAWLTPPSVSQLLAPIITLDMCHRVRWTTSNRTHPGKRQIAKQCSNVLMGASLPIGEGSLHLVNS